MKKIFRYDQSKRQSSYEHKYMQNPTSMRTSDLTFDHTQPKIDNQSNLLPVSIKRDMKSSIKAGRQNRSISFAQCYK